jgi:hypothetical protein
MTTDETDVLDDCDFDEICTVVLSQAGPEALKELIARGIEEKTYSKERLFEIANTLDSGGVEGGAQIVRDAANKIEESVSPEIVRILQTPIRSNLRACLAGFYHQRGGVLTAEEASFISENVHKDDVDFMLRAVARRVRYPGGHYSEWHYGPFLEKNRIGLE